MPQPAILQKLVLHVLQFVTLLGTAAWSVYWLTMRVPVADWRILLVGLLISAVLGWWPWISLGVVSTLTVAMLLFSVELDGVPKGQVLEELAIFWALGLGWGLLAKTWLAVPQPRLRQRPTSHLPPPPLAQVPLRTAEDATFRSRRLMAGASEEVARPASIDLPTASVPKIEAPVRETVHETVREAALPPAPSAKSFPVFKDPDSDLVVPTSGDIQPPPRPMAALSSYDAGGESVFAGNLPGLQTPKETSSHLFVDAIGQESVDAPTMTFKIPDDSEHPLPIQPPPGAATAELRLEAMPPRPPVLEDPSVVSAGDPPTLVELPVNTLLRSAPRPSQNPNSSFHLPVSSHPSSTGSAGDPSEFDAQSIRRSSSFLRPETLPGSPHEHVLEWYNQFSWSPWTVEELEKRYYRPGVQVGWTSMALADLAKVWKVWKAGPVPPPVGPGQVSLGALEGFLRCEILGTLRHQGHPDLHLLSQSPEGDSWVPVYHEVRGRFRGGDAVIHRTDKLPMAADAKELVVGLPDRFAEVRGESDVIALVTPFSVGESLSWTSVYALAQQRVAETMGRNLSGVPVVINLPLPVWDERRVPRVVVVEDMASEQRRLDAALERFNKVLSGLVPPKPQAQVSVCNGCGWRHACPQYSGGRPRLDLSKPPQQIAAALR